MRASGAEAAGAGAQWLLSRTGCRPGCRSSSFNETCRCALQGIRRVEAVTGQKAEAAIAQAEVLSASVDHADTLQGAELEDRVKDLKKASCPLVM